MSLGSPNRMRAVCKKVWLSGLSRIPPKGLGLGDEQFKESLWRVFTALAPRLAAHNPPDRFSTTLQQAVFTNGLNRISATRRLKPTRGGQHRADENLIKAHASDHTCGRQSDNSGDQRS